MGLQDKLTVSLDRMKPFASNSKRAGVRMVQRQTLLVTHLDTYSMLHAENSCSIDLNAKKVDVSARVKM